MEAPQDPAGAYEREVNYGPKRREEFIGIIEAAPQALRAAVAGLTNPQLDTRYRNWTIRQIVHHIADSHINAYVRFRLALTEDGPTITPYEEGRWVLLEDAAHEDPESSLRLLEALHRRWVVLLRAMGDDDYRRTFFHPEAGRAQSLEEVLGYYAWHGRHHTGQILWLREQHGW